MFIPLESDVGAGLIHGLDDYAPLLGHVLGEGLRLWQGSAWRAGGATQPTHAVIVCSATKISHASHSYQPVSGVTITYSQAYTQAGSDNLLTVYAILRAVIVKTGCLPG
jgi:hypothetical protein